MKTLIIILSGLSAFSSLNSFAADMKFVCADPQTGLVENLTIKGSGLTASIHMEDITMVGDCTYYPHAVEGLDGYVIFTGSFTTKLENPPATLQGAFLFEPALLDGKPANMRRFAGEGFLTIPCKKVTE